jgi:hypothetical protein
MHAALQAHYGGPQQPKPLAYQVADKVGMGQVLGALDGLQHHGLNAVHGLAQLGEHGLNAAANALLPAPQHTLSGLVSGQQPEATGLAGVRQSINRATAADDASIAQRERDYQARTAGNAGSYVGAAAGEILPWMVGVGEARALGLLPKATSTLGKAGLLAGEGAAMGAATPVTEGGDYATQKATQIGVGAATAPALGLGSQVLGHAGSYLTDAGRERLANARLAKLVGDVDPQAMRGASNVPGFQPSIAQVLPDPRLLQAERVLRNDPAAAPAFAAQHSANNAYLRDYVAQVAGTDADLAAAKAARTAATSPYYGQLPGKGVDPAPVLQALDALHNSGLGVRPNIRQAVTGLRNEITSRLSPNGTIDADILSGLHQNAGSHLGPMASSQEKLALGPIKDSIADALDRAVPGYRANLAAYGAASQPISDMQAGRSLLDAIDSAGRDAGGNQNVSLSAARKALNADNRAQYPMSAPARQKIEHALDALQQRSISDNKIAASGPGTAAELRQGLLSSDLGRKAMTGTSMLLGTGMGHLLGIPGVGETGGAILGGLLSESAQAANRSVMRKVGTKAANAEKAAEALQAYQRHRQGLLGQLPNYLLPYGAPQFPLLMQQTP